MTCSAFKYFASYLSGMPCFVWLEEAHLCNKAEMDFSGRRTLQSLRGWRNSLLGRFIHRFQWFPICNIKGIWGETGQNIAFWETSNQMA